jgi:hypothetical protein
LLLFYKPLLLEAQHCLQERRGNVDITNHYIQGIHRPTFMIHVDASGKSNHTNHTCKFVKSLKVDLDDGYKRSAVAEKHAPRQGKGRKGS